MKVISGYLKGRKIDGFDIDGTRPTMDRVKESLFAMIQDFVLDSHCLDLYAGSGNLGIEALSNGAKYCYFVDHNKKAIRILNDNLKNFSLEKISRVWCMEDMMALKRLKEEKIQFNLVFLDPPYLQDNLINTMRYFDKTNLLKDNGLVVCELTNLGLLEEYTTLTLYKKRQYRDKWIVIFRKNSEK